MRCAGIDIGSRSIKLVVVENNRIALSRKTDTGFDPLASANALICDINADAMIATGYGRNLFEIEYDGDTVTEIKAHAKGAHHMFPQADTVLDIGGQDSKVIRMNDAGTVIRFEMNDRCAAGTGKFLEIMAASLGFSLENFGENALSADEELEINSMCTVFAESEVTSLVARGKDRCAIAKGLHNSVAKRAATMLNRMNGDRAIVFTGGVANNICMKSLLQGMTDKQMLISDAPEFTGALGAALIAAEKAGE